MKSLVTILLLLTATLLQAQCDSLYFDLSAKNPTCHLTDGRIQITNLHGTSPFQITGTGNSLTAGTYTVTVKDACNNVRSRQVTLAPYTFDFTWSFHGIGCSGFQFDFPDTTLTYSLDGGYLYQHGPITGNIALPYNLTIRAKDSCGNIVTHTQYLNKEYGGYIKELQKRIQCDRVDIFPIYYGFNAPSVCLYDHATHQLIQCKQAPAGYTTGPLTNFFDVDYSHDYYVIVQDGCYRDSAYFPVTSSSGGSELNPYNWDCTTFTMHVDGMEDTVCLYNAATNTLISCKGQDQTSINPRTGVPWPSGAVWENLPYGCYYAWIYDPCEKKTFKIDTCVHYPNGFEAIVAGHCSVEQSAVIASFKPESKAPYHIKVLYPDESVAINTTVYNASSYNLYNTWPNAGTLTVIASDNCGFADTSYVLQQSLIPVRTKTVRQGCPGLFGSSGGGDITITSEGIVSIIKKDGITVTIPVSYQSGNEYHFTNLPTGVYVLQSQVGCYGYKLFDTVEIKPYDYPVQWASPNQCSVSQLTFKDSIIGGSAPYTFEIISPVFLSGTNNLLTLATGDTIKSITVKVTDGCGNSDLKTFAVPWVKDCYGLPVKEQVKPAKEDKNIKVYPNPSSGIVHITGNKIVTIYDAGDGGILFKGFTKQVWLNKGVYVIEVNGVKYKQIIL